MTANAALAEIRRVKRVADQSCSAHARLRDRFAFRATMLDVVVLAASAWTLSLAFVDPALAPKLTPFQLTSTLWIGLLSVATFVVTLVQLKLDLKGRSDSHKRACEAQAELKRAAADAEDRADDESLASVKAKQTLALAVGAPIPEAEFLRQKRIHLAKVALSRHLDEYPHASLTLLRLKWWWRDNFSPPRDPADEDAPEGAGR